MCLAIPGKVVRWLVEDPLLALAEVEFAGVTRRCHMACVTEARIGDFVVVHAGVAIARLDADEAARVLAELASLPDVDEWAAADREEEAAS
jgi:hydrogenase expression/formation protein HypC